MIKFTKLDFFQSIHDNLPKVVFKKSVSIAKAVTAVITKERFTGKDDAYLREDLNYY